MQTNIFPGILSKRFGKHSAKVRFSALGTAHFSARDCTNVLWDCTFVQYCNLQITPVKNSDQKRCKNMIEHVGIKIESTSYCSLPRFGHSPPLLLQKVSQGGIRSFPPTVFFNQLPPHWFGRQIALWLPLLRDSFCLRDGRDLND